MTDERPPQRSVQDDAGSIGKRRRMAIIRTYQPSDVEQVLNIWLEASARAHDFVAREFWESKVEDMRDVYLPAAETYVYEENGTVRGFVSLHGDSIAALFVAPTEQGAGIGGRLMGKAKEVRHELTLTVYKENRRGVRFYEKCGFAVRDERLDSHTGHPELVMAYGS